MRDRRQSRCGQRIAVVMMAGSGDRRSGLHRRRKDGLLRGGDKAGGAARFVRRTGIGTIPNQTPEETWGA